MKLAALALCVIGLATPASPAGAAESTEIIDAYPAASPWALRPSLGLTWRWRQRRSAVRRELACVARETLGGASLCPDGSRVVLARDLATERVSSQLDVDARVGLGRLAMLRLSVQVVLGDLTRLSFDDGVSKYSSLTAPYNRPRLLSVPSAGPDRSGLGDPTLALRVAPLGASGELDQPAFAVEISLLIPAAPTRRAANEAVGGGAWRVGLSAALSARVWPWLEPFFSLDAQLGLAEDRSVFVALGPTQTVTEPASRLGASFGVEFVPFERPATRSAVRLELGGRLELVGDGRGYSDLFESLGASPCDPASADAPCGLTTYDRADVDPTTGLARRADGITTIEHHALLSGWLGVRYEVFESLRLSARARVAGETDHFLTFADAGVDLDGGGDVRPGGADGVNELNPVYNSEYDQPGHRLRSGDTLTLGVDLAIQGRF